MAGNVKVIKRESNERQFTSSILIIPYNTFARKRKYCSFSTDSIFGKSCPSKHRCQWSCDRQRLREADALIFYGSDLPYSQTPILKRSETKPNSIWILLSDEPCSAINYALYKSYYFNWTISYKLNSEASIGAFGLFIKRDIPLSNKEYQYWIQNEFSKRTKGALWFVSNCRVKKRLKLFHALQHASKLPIEGYGQCADYYPMHLCRSFSYCEYDYASKFKFYLSFESNACRDYITEKFYKAFYYGLIPIVSGPERIDYNPFAPNNSFIHVNDFDKDMNKLASYLEKIYSNLTLFSMYHEWRKHYEVIVHAKALERIRMCELCERLTDVRKGEMVYYRNIEEFYADKCDSRPYAA